jgi:hypothetical protein
MIGIYDVGPSIRHCRRRCYWCQPPLLLVPAGYSSLPPLSALTLAGVVAVAAVVDFIDIRWVFSAVVPAIGSVRRWHVTSYLSRALSCVCHVTRYFCQREKPARYFVPFLELEPIQSRHALLSKTVASSIVLQMVADHPLHAHCPLAL